MAKPGGGDAHSYLAGPRVTEFDRLDRNRPRLSVRNGLLHAIKYSGAHLHFRLPNVFCLQHNAASRPTENHAAVTCIH